MADGRIFIGQQAKDIGLIDEIGALGRAVRKAQELADIEAKPVTNSATSTIGV